MTSNPVVITFTPSDPELIERLEAEYWRLVAAPRKVKL